MAGSGSTDGVRTREAVRGARTCEAVRGARTREAVSGARTREAVLRGIGIGLGCALVIAAVVPTLWCLLAPAGGGLLGAFYAKAPTATDALIERAEAMHAMRDGPRG